MRKFIFVLLLVLPLALCSCQIFAREETVEFELPAWPDYLPPLEGWTLIQDGLSEPVTVQASARIITLKLDKNKPCSISLAPLSQNNFFKPAGTIYPYSQKLSWSGGYAVQLFRLLQKAADLDITASFNWEKLMENLEQKEADSLEQDSSPFYNPWLLDSQEALEAIAYHNFTANKIKLSNSLSIPLDFKVYSSYVPENELSLQQKGSCVSVRMGQPEIFALCDSCYLIISATSAKNISLDLVSMPIFKEGL